MINTAYYGMIILIVFFAGYFLVPVLLPFLVAFLVAAVTVKPAGRFAGMPPAGRKGITLICTIMFYCIVLLVVAVAGRRLLLLAGNLLVKLPSFYQSEVLPLLNGIFGKLEELLAPFDPYILESIETSFQQATQNLGQAAYEISVGAVKLASGYITAVPSLIVKLVITVIATFFIALDYEKVTGFLKGLLPEKGQKLWEVVKSYSKNVFWVYLKSYSFLMCLTFAELAAGFLILRIPYAVWLALAIAIFDILPILGTGGILLPWAAVMCLTGNYPLAAGLLVLYLIITVIRNILEPKIVGKQIGLHPLAALAALFVGLKLCGIVGMIAFPVGLSILLNMEKSGMIDSLRKKAGAEETEGM